MFNSKLMLNIIIYKININKQFFIIYNANLYNYGIKCNLLTTQLNCRH